MAAPPRFGKDTRVHLFKRLLLAAVRQQANHVFRLRRGEGRHLLQKNTVWCFFDLQTCAGTPVPPFPDRAGEDHLSLGRDGGYEFFGTSYRKLTPCKTQVRYSSGGVLFKSAGLSVLKP